MRQLYKDELDKRLQILKLNTVNGNLEEEWKHFNMNKNEAKEQYKNGMTELETKQIY